MSRENIKPGYQLHVASWENDGDNNMTEVVSGLSKDEARFLILIADAFGSRYGKPDATTPYSVSGNDENDAKEFLKLWKFAAEKFPEVAAKYFEGPLPTEEELELFDELHELRYNDPRKNDAKYDAVRDYRSAAATFLENFNETVREMLGSPGEGYWDMKNFHRVCDSIQVFYIPAAVENVTNQFINEKGKLI